MNSACAPTPDRVLHVAAHQAERFESLGDHHRRFVVHPVVERVRSGQFERAVVGRQHDVVNVFCLPVKRPLTGNVRVKSLQ